MAYCATMSFSYTQFPEFPPKLRLAGTNDLDRIKDGRSYLVSLGNFRAEDTRISFP